jgi:uncharacterized membrane protein YhaH (DUF805 family)
MDPVQKPAEGQSQRPFWQQYLMVMGIVTIIVVVGALLLGNIRQISNLYFWSTLILFIIAAVPIFTEVGTSAKIAGKAIKDGEKIGDQLKEKQSTFDRGARITYLFGLSGITTFVLAFLTLAIG